MILEGASDVQYSLESAFQLRKDVSINAGPMQLKSGKDLPMQVCKELAEGRLLVEMD